MPSGGLNASPVPENGVAAKANSIAIPAGFNPKDPASVAAALASLPTNGSDTFSKSQVDDVGLIGPALEIERLEIGSGPVLEVVDYGYALTLPAETFTLATGAVVEVVDGVPVPAAEIVVQGLAPVVAIGAAVLVPIGVVAVAALTPDVDVVSGSVSVPVDVVTVAGLVPEIPRGVIAVAVPAVDLTILTMPPAVVAGLPVTPPLVITVAALSPTVFPASEDELAFWGWQEPGVLLFGEAPER